MKDQLVREGKNLLRCHVSFSEWKFEDQQRTESIQYGQLRLVRCPRCYIAYLKELKCVRQLRFERVSRSCVFHLV